MKIDLPLRVLAFETDYGGVVSNTRYVEYIERGRHALLHAAGLNITQIWDEHGVQPVVRSVAIDYLGFARHEDELVLTVAVGEHSGSATWLNYECLRADGRPTMRAVQTLAYINRYWKRTRVPALFRAALPAEPNPVETNED